MARQQGTPYHHGGRGNPSCTDCRRHGTRPTLQQKNNISLFVGAGFFGTGMLDGYHAVVTSTAFAPYLPSDLPALIPWSWVASRFFLSLLLFLSSYIWHRDQKNSNSTVVHERHAYALVAILTLLSFVFFAFAPYRPPTTLILHSAGRKNL